MTNFKDKNGVDILIDDVVFERVQDSCEVNQELIIFSKIKEIKGRFFLLTAGYDYSNKHISEIITIEENHLNIEFLLVTHKVCMQYNNNLKSSHGHRDNT